MNSGFYDVTVVDSRLCADQITVEIDLVTTWQEFTYSHQLVVLDITTEQFLFLWKVVVVM